MKKNVLDLFCGIGGFSQGFEKSGFHLVAGIDNWIIALDTFKQNHPNTVIINSDIHDLDNRFFKKWEKYINHYSWCINFGIHLVIS